MKGIDLSFLPSKGLALDLARWSNAFGGKGRGSRKGVERRWLRLKGETISCGLEAVFEEFGHIRFKIEARIATKAGKLLIQSTDWVDPPRSAHVRGKVSNTKKLTWTYDVEDVEGRDSLEVPLTPKTFPVTFQRFIPLLMKRRSGEAVSFSSLPEDAFPWWRPKAKGSFFPLDAAPSTKEIRCVGTDTFRRGREELSGWTFEQHGDAGLEHWWMVSDSGQLLAMSWKRTLWLPEDPKIVASELAKG